jgi:hypothetical protein
MAGGVARWAGSLVSGTDVEGESAVSSPGCRTARRIALLKARATLLLREAAGTRGCACGWWVAASHSS